jgi:hypothetical protein
VKNRQKKVLLFPKPPEQPQDQTMTIQVGNQRFAIHYEIENLPPAPLPELVVRRSPARPTRIGVVTPLKRKEGLEKRSARKPHANGD